MGIYLFSLSSICSFFLCSFSCIFDDFWFFFFSFFPDSTSYLGCGSPNVSSTVLCDRGLIWKEGLGRCDQVQVRTGSGWALISGHVLRLWGHRDTENPMEGAGRDGNRASHARSDMEREQQPEVRRRQRGLLEASLTDTWISILCLLEGREEMSAANVLGLW